MKKIIDNFYDFNINRTGLSKESDLYHLKAKAIVNLQSACEKRNIKFYFDCSFERYDNKFSVSSTGCNYGIFLMIPSFTFYSYLFDVHIKNKKLEKVLDIDLKEEYFISKYNHDNKYKFNNKIKGVAVLPNQNKLINLDFIKLNSFMNEDGNFLKIHPVTSATYVDYLTYVYGKDKLINSKYDMFDILMNCETVAITKNTEVMIPTSLYDKNIYLLANETRTPTTYPFLYNILKHGIKVQKVFESEYLGLIPWSLINDINYIHHLLDKWENLHAKWRDSIYNCSF